MILFNEWVEKGVDRKKGGGSSTVRCTTIFVNCVNHYLFKTKKKLPVCEIAFHGGCLAYVRGLEIALHNLIISCLDSWLQPATWVLHLIYLELCCPEG